MGETKTVRPAVVGNRMVLTGAVMYLLEFVAIIGVAFAGVGTNTSVGSEPDAILETYTGNVDPFAFMAGWFAVVLLGRILLFVGIKHALAASGRPSPLMDFAVAAAAVSVTLEIAAYGLGSAAADLAGEGEDRLVVLLDQAGAWLNMLLMGGLGVAVAVAAACMWRSGLFSTALNVLGLVAGLGMVAAQLSISPVLGPVLSVLAWSPLVFWVWMIWAGVVIWRRSPRRTPAAAEPDKEFAVG